MLDKIINIGYCISDILTPLYSHMEDHISFVAYFSWKIFEKKTSKSDENYKNYISCEIGFFMNFDHFYLQNGKRKSVDMEAKANILKKKKRKTK